MAARVTLTERILRQFPSITTFTVQYAAEKLGCSKQGAAKAIAKLHATGAIRITRWGRSTPGAKFHPVYRLSTAQSRNDVPRPIPKGPTAKKKRPVGRPPGRTPQVVKVRGTKAAVKEWFAERRSRC